MSGTGPPVRDADVAGDHRAAKAGGDEVAVVHARAADDPGGLIGQAADDKGMFGRRQDHGRVQRVDLDPRAAGRGKFVCAAGKAPDHRSGCAMRPGRFVAPFSSRRRRPWPDNTATSGLSAG